jgi:hypothetical protein
VFGSAPVPEDDSAPEQDRREGEPDGYRGCVPDPVSVCNQHDDLRDDDAGDAREKRLPAALRGHDRRRGEHDHGERGRARGHARVEGLQCRRQRRAEEADAREDLRSPRKRDGRGEGGDRGCERQSHRIRHEVVARRRRREGRVTAGRTRPDRGERGVQMSEAGSEGETAREHERRGDGADQDAFGRPDPAAVGSQHEQEPDPQRRDRPTDDREAARPHELPALEELSWRPGGRRGRWGDRGARRGREPPGGGHGSLDQLIGGWCDGARLLRRG